MNTRVFADYAAYYDLIYRDKNYKEETNYIINLVKKYNPSAKTILEAGCGTGNHAILLAEKGFKVHGIDFSQNMIDIANSKLKKLPENLKNLLYFQNSNICCLELGKKFDAVVSLFHVMSYQASNYALEKAFHSVSKHLSRGGIFIFDCWYGPAVLSDRPSVRIKRFEDENFKVTRIAEPLLYPNENTVDVNFHIIIKNKINDAVEEFQELHRMRYFFKPETEFLLTSAGFKPVYFQEWLNEKEPGFDSWNVCFIGEKL